MEALAYDKMLRAALAPKTPEEPGGFREALSRAQAEGRPRDPALPPRQRLRTDGGGHAHRKVRGPGRGGR